MGELIPFPKRDSQVLRVQTMAAHGLTFIGRCDGIVHCFSTVPGHCECGEEFWDGADIPNGIGIYEVPPE